MFIAKKNLCDIRIEWKLQFYMQKFIKDMWFMSGLKKMHFIWTLVIKWCNHLEILILNINSWAFGVLLMFANTYLLIS